MSTGGTEVVPPADPIDVVLGRDGIYRSCAEEMPLSRAELVWRAVRSHRETNDAYDRYCVRQGLPDQDDPELPLDRVPLLPTVLFKRDPALVLSKGGTPPLTDTTSSGTLGTVSTVPRCDATLMRFFGTVAIGDREILGSETFDRAVFNVGPTIRDAPNLWIAMVMAGVGVIMPSRSYLDEERLLAEELARDLQRDGRDRNVLLVGPPPLLLDLARVAAQDTRLRLGPGSQVLTIGGWKRRGGEMVEKAAFRSLMADAFGLERDDQVRDTYNMVELNSVLFECAHHALHVPPWLAAMARDPRTLAVLPSGAGGLLSFLDPTAVSYPCFILTDDFGSVRYDAHCACGTAGDTVTIERRVNRVESRGCALKLDVEGRSS
ncbi:hypothetical protein ACOZ38_27480 [Sphaerisporangium viridialbum]|uniref:LuxE/PaaK family acyltransferase n=1 Tax=Sphaerisporangium viridialbum TaxID=46189 RepID=UPI003C77C68E